MQIALGCNGPFIVELFRECIAAIERAAREHGHSIKIANIYSDPCLNCDILLLFAPWWASPDKSGFSDLVFNGIRPVVLFQSEPLFRKGNHRFMVPWLQRVNGIIDIIGQHIDSKCAIYPCPIGYDPAFKMNCDSTENQYWDVGFVGNLVGSNRRSSLLESLQNTGLKVWCDRFIWGRQRNLKIVDTKIMIDIGFTDTATYSPIRIEGIFIPLKSFVIAESVPTNRLISLRPEIDFIMSDINNIADKIMIWLNNEKQRREIASEAFRFISCIQEDFFFGNRVINILHHIHAASTNR